MAWRNFITNSIKKMGIAPLAAVRLLGQPGGQGRIQVSDVGREPVPQGDIGADLEMSNLVATWDFGKISLGYAHNLSKRTVLYTTAARLSQQGPGHAQPGGGLDIGIRRAF